MELKPYQVEGAVFLSSRKAAFLADQMGLGKSAQAIEAANLVGAQKVVVICPAIARVNWQREFEMWGRGARQLVVESFDKVATRPELRKALVDMRPDVMIVDEAHYLKTRTAKRTKSLYGAACKGTGLVAAAKHVWLLSGTPCPNDAGELWPHLKALWPDLIGDKNYAEFIERYCLTQKTVYGVKILGNRNAPELRGVLKQIMLRRKADDVLKDLPPISWHVTPVEPDHVLKDLVAFEQTEEIAVLRQSLEDGTIPTDSVAMATLRRITGQAKAQVAARLISDELESDAYQKIVVFVQHLDVGKTLSSELEKFGTMFLNGSTTPTMRQQYIDAFQKDASKRVFIGQLQACSTAITLHAASQVLFVEQSWVPAENAQAAKRCHRIGQTQPVFVRMLALSKSIDEAVARVLARKTQAISELMEN